MWSFWWAPVAGPVTKAQLVFSLLWDPSAPATRHSSRRSSWGPVCAPHFKEGSSWEEQRGSSRQRRVPQTGEGALSLWRSLVPQGSVWWHRVSREAGRYALDLQPWPKSPYTSHNREPGESPVFSEPWEPKSQGAWAGTTARIPSLPVFQEPHDPSRFLCNSRQRRDLPTEANVKFHNRLAEWRPRNRLDFISR